VTISYNKLFKLLIDRGIRKKDLKEAAGIGSATMAKLSRNQPVALEVLVKICAHMGCNIGDIADVVTDKKDGKADTYTRILTEELIPAIGCTEPSAIAFVAARAAEVLGSTPERGLIEVSGNIVKNTKSVVVPNTGGLKGIRTAAAAGFLSASAARGLEILSELTPEQREEITPYINSHELELVLADVEKLLYIAITAYCGDEYARVVVEDGHTRVTWIEKNGKLIFELDEDAPQEQSAPDYSLLDIEDIVHFADTADLVELRPLLARQVEYNYAIAMEGLEHDWGANVGRALLLAFGDDIKIRAAAAAAAGSDARMSGCEMPVIVLSGSGNQGIAASVPVIVYAREMNSTEDELYRALIVADLVTVHQKTGIGKLSAFCGAVSACCGAAAGVSYLQGGDYEAIAHTIVNTLATVSGIVCDGAKPSCAAKIAVSFMAGLLGNSMFTEGNWQFFGGDGILTKGVDNTIANVGQLASCGMRETDREILKIISEN
jgi:L-cysteine desulfidase/DNA-binding Xre family transcriptional regulator